MESGQGDQPPLPAPEQPVLDYRSPHPEVISPQKRRSTVPWAAGIGFTGTAGLLAASWLALDERFIPHVALYLAGGVGLASAGLAARRRTRLFGIGGLLAIGIWLLMLGACSRTGLVEPWAF